MTIFITIIVFILILVLLIVSHEFGHFMAAKLSGIGVKEFGFGFPPRLIGFYKDKNKKWHFVRSQKQMPEINEEYMPETVYSINAVPLGGFVSMIGDQGGEDMNYKYSFAKQSVGKRAFIIVAGVFMNLVVAYLLLSVGFMIGLPASDVNSSDVSVVQVSPNSPASYAGLVAGEQILGITASGHYTKITSMDAVENIVDANAGSPIALDLKYGNQTLSKTLTPRSNHPQDQGAIGITMENVGIAQYPWYESFIKGAEALYSLTVEIIVLLYAFFRSLILGQTSFFNNVAGPIGIASVTGQALKLGWNYVINLAAVLSINLAIMNILPIPALDGGRLFFILLEKMKGRPVQAKIENMAHQVGFALLILLMVVVTYHDIIHYL